MKKLAVFLVLLLFLFSSCVKRAEFIAPSGSYTLDCRIGEINYNIFLELAEDLSGKITFSPDSAMGNLSFTRSSDGKIKSLNSLGYEVEAGHENTEKIFDFVTLSYEKIADISHEKISSRDVSVLKLADGSIVYTDSQSGEPLRLVFDDMTVDILSRPEKS